MDNSSICIFAVVNAPLLLATTSKTRQLCKSGHFQDNKRKKREKAKALPNNKGQRPCRICIHQEPRFLGSSGTLSIFGRAQASPKPQIQCFFLSTAIQKKSFQTNLPFSNIHQKPIPLGMLFLLSVANIQKTTHRF